MKRLANVGEVIAARRLRLEDEPNREVTLFVGKPVDDGDGYSCPYQIQGIGKEKVGVGIGVDAVQALEEAIRILPIELAALLSDHPTLRWEDAPAGYFGFRPHSEAPSTGD